MTAVQTPNATPRAAGLRPPWPKGTSGNPNGRPKDVGLVAELRGCLEELGKDGEPNRKRVAKRLVELCIEGNITAIQYVFDRFHGKPTPALPDGATGGIMFLINGPGDIEEPDIIEGALGDGTDSRTD